MTDKPANADQLRNRLAYIATNDGTTIERYPGDKLVITDKHGRTLDPRSAEYERVAAWFWSSVAVKGNDPNPYAIEGDSDR